MVAQKRTRDRKWLWISLGVILVILVVVGVVIGINNNSEKHNEVSEDNKTERVEEKNETKEGEVGKEDNQEEETNPQTPIQNEGENPNKSEELTGVITYASVVEGKLMIRVSIDQYLTSGDCKLTLKRGGAIIYSEMAEILSEVSTATCKGFDVPVDGFGNGETEITIDLNSNGKNGIIYGRVNI